MFRSTRSELLFALIITAGALAACSSEQRSRLAMGSALESSGWLGSAEGWGLLGLPPGGGPVSYRRAATLESPTWAPPELERLTDAWPAGKAIWIQFPGSRIARYEYATGHLLTWEEEPSTRLAVAPVGRDELVIVAGEKQLANVGRAAHWQFELDEAPVALQDAGDGRVLAVLGDETDRELMVLDPTVDTAISRRRVPDLRRVAVSPWGDRLYYLAADSVVHGLTLPDLGEADGFPLPGPGQALAVTPSAHRVYVAAADSLHVFNRLNGQRVRSVAMPDSVTDLRFAITGATLLARIPRDSVAVLAVGVDSLLGVIRAGWDDDLPVVIPGDRLVARVDSQLVLHDALTLTELARADVGDGERWFAVEWQPPRPRPEAARRPQAPVAVRASPPRPAGDGAPADSDVVASAGFYAVVSAARERAGVDNLVTWLRSVGYPGVVDEHVDPMGVTWHRAMVGPYPDRQRAEDAAQSLAARYGYKPWILSIGASPNEEGRVREGEGEGEGGNGNFPSEGNG